MQTFVVRLWTPGADPAEAPPERLRGVVEDLGSGRSATFTHDGELVAFLRERREEREQVGGGAA